MEGIAGCMLDHTLAAATTHILGISVKMEVKVSKFNFCGNLLSKIITLYNLIGNFQRSTKMLCSQNVRFILTRRFQNFFTIISNWIE